MGLLGAVGNFFSSVYIFLWDTLLAFGNLILPKRPHGLVVPDGHPGFGGKWPEYIPAKEGDSRCSCPGINALANHGKPPYSVYANAGTIVSDRVQGSSRATGGISLSSN